MKIRANTRDYVEALRLERWPRCLAVIPGFIASITLVPQIPGDYLHTYILPAGQLLLAFLLTLAVSAANYIINEITDVSTDIYHPIKKKRPAAEGRVDRTKLIILWGILLILSIGTASLCFKSNALILCLLALAVAGILYNVKPIRIKDIPFLDSTFESANNPIRFLIGWYILGTAFPPFFLLLSWWALGNFLVLGKRVAEKKFLTEEQSSSYRRSLKQYNLCGLIGFMYVNAAISVAAFAWFAFQSKLNSFLISIPFVVVYLVFYFKKTRKDMESAVEPEKLLRNPYFVIYTLLMAAIFIIAHIFN